VLLKITPAASFLPSSKVGWKILCTIMVVGGWGMLATWAFWGSMPKPNCAL
jgi:hypothetical protein